MSSNKPILYAELTYGDTTVRLSGTRISEGAYVTADGVDGWYSTPESKWSLTERSYSDGAYPIDEDQIVYASRVVTAQIGVIAKNRATVLDLWRSILACAHHECRFRVVDDKGDSYVCGYPTVTSEATWDRRNNQGTLTIQCPDPRRLSTDGDSCTLLPSSAGITGGLQYGGDSAGLVYDLSYGAVDGESGNVGTVSNNGSATAYPVVTVFGVFEDGFTLYMTTGGKRYEVSYGAYVTKVPIVLDFRARQATCGGSDRSSGLTARGFAGIAPGSSATFNLQAEGSGYAYVEVHDTFI